MSSDLLLTAREAETVTLLSEGVRPKDMAARLGVTSANTLIRQAKAKAEVATLRALVYVCLAREWIPRPAPLEHPVEVDETTECLWAGLRLDVPEGRLLPVLADLAKTSVRETKDSLAALVDRYGVSRCGLITLGFASGVLSGREGTQTSRPSPAAPVVQNETDTVTTRPPAGGRHTGTGPWALTRRQHDALEQLAVSRSFEEAARRLGISTEGFRKHLGRLTRIAGVNNHRALLHEAIRLGQLPCPAGAPAQSALPPDVRSVWAYLVLNVPDDELETEISAVTHLPLLRVKEVLKEMRHSEEEPGWRMVVRGWACGAITGQNRTALPTRTSGPAARGANPAGPRLAVSAGRRLPVSAGPRLPVSAGRRLPVSAGPRLPDSAGPRPAGAERLRLVPDGLSWSASGVSRRGGVPAGTAILTGHDFDLVRVDPDACRRLLAGIPARWWGPVVGHVEANTALLVTAAGALGPGWRTRHGRLWRAGARVHLPPEHRPGPGGMYWAVSCRAPRWSAARLEQFLDDLPGGVR